MPGVKSTIAAYAGDKQSSKLIIQIPCFNEEPYIANTLADLPRSVEGIGAVEYLVIDDGSSDGTAEAAKAAGAHHVIRLTAHQGLARAFMEGLQAALALDADIIVNTDADNQYQGVDIPRLIKPILDRKADIVIGERPIMSNPDFSWMVKIFQKLGSWVVRLASGTDVPDAPSGFRAISRRAALQMNVFMNYTYTLETIIQAGRKNLAVVSVPITTNPKIRESRLMKSKWRYVFRSAQTILRIFVLYKPMRFFGTLGTVIFIVGLIPAVRFLIHYFMGQGKGNIQSLIFGSVMVTVGFQMVIYGLMADMIAANRKVLEELQYQQRAIQFRRKSAAPPPMEETEAP